MLNPKLILIIVAIIGIGGVFFLFKDKISSSNLSNSNQGTSTSKEEAYSNKGDTDDGSGKQQGDSTSSEDTPTLATTADEEWINECSKNKFVAGSYEMGGIVTLGKEKHVINNKTVELCCFAAVDPRQSVDSIEAKKCEDATKNAIGLEKENGKFVPAMVVYIENNQSCVVTYDSDGIAADPICNDM